MSESSCFRTPFGIQHVKESQTLLKPGAQHLRPNFPLISDRLIGNISVLVRTEMLELFFNTFTAYHMFSRQIYEKFPQQVQTQLSSKPKSFSQIVTTFTKST